MTAEVQVRERERKRDRSNGKSKCVLLRLENQPIDSIGTHGMARMVDSNRVSKYRRQRLGWTAGSFSKYGICNSNKNRQNSPGPLQEEMSMINGTINEENKHSPCRYSSTHRPLFHPVNHSPVPPLPLLIARFAGMGDRKRRGK